MVTPSAFSRAIRLNKASVSPGVSVAVGSSITSRRARRARALAISTSCFSATISRRTGVSGLTARPTWASACAASARMAASSSSQPRFFSWPRKMFCAIVRSSARLNSWWMSTMPAASASREPAKATGWPPMRSVPPLGCSWPARIFISVLLPAPFSPSRPTTVPGCTSKLTPCSTCTGPKRLVMPSNCTCRLMRPPLSASPAAAPRHPRPPRRPRRPAACTGSPGAGCSAPDCGGRCSAARWPETAARCG